ncbi:DUF748 domain-containing protein [Aliiglaciecola lipolytica]|uniref:DUF748 domain-containing protein n=1 Tax=Aliiglaciecola lipolytica E3 TaxID=1127673 RepID=K6WYF6_9ALTE|nr:DUF748 domain-containing protein [Aliiglaciecola lipolytica]GAC13494.1 hypothetical protein GLIP_0849 [Aliiglaciecola lipolytica E3]
MLLKKIYSSKSRKYISITVLCTLVILLLARVSAPYFVQRFINNTIASTDGLSGQVGDVDLHLYRGAYQIEDINLYVVGETDDARPLISVKKMDISILWSALLRGNIVSELTFYQPKIYLEDRENTQDIQNEEVKKQSTWVGLTQNLVPFSIDKITIFDGEMALKNINDEVESETRLSEVQGQISNITNSKELGKPLVSEFQLSAKLMDAAPVTLAGNIDPFAQKPTFNLDLTVAKFPVTYLDNVIKTYTPIDIEAGSVDGALELVSENGKIDGYAKAGIYNMEILSWREDIEKDGDNIFVAIFEGLTDLLGTLLENDEENLIAARVPISGTLSDTETETFAAILSMLRNAFIEALQMDIEDLFSINPEETSESESDNTNSNPDSE